MKINEKSGLVIFAKSFLSGIMFYTLGSIISVVLSIIFQASPERRFTGYSFWSIMLLSFILSLFMLPNYLHTAKTIRMDNKEVFEEMITRALVKQKWKLESREEARMVFYSGIWFPTWREKVIIRFTDTDLQISGPREYIERAIKLAKFPYGAFEINTFD